MKIQHSNGAACFLCIGVLLGICHGSSQVRGDQAASLSPLEFPQNIAVAEFVHRAADAIREQGEAVFDAMNKEGEWFDKETGRYVFVYAADLVTVVNAAFPEMRGKRVGAQDPRKFYACSRLLEGTVPEIWGHADWRDAATGEFGCKTALMTIVTAPSGARYLLGSGMLNLPPEKRFIEELVESAASAFEASGTNVFAALAQADGPFRFQDFYVFIDTPNHVEIFNPAFPEVVGTDFSDVQGADGRYFVREYVAKALNEGSGWTEYEWPRPGETTPSKKLAYTRKAEHNGQVVVVGAGLYPEPPPPRSP